MSLPVGLESGYSSEVSVGLLAGVDLNHHLSPLLPNREKRVSNWCICVGGLILHRLGRNPEFANTLSCIWGNTSNLVKTPVHS